MTDLSVPISDLHIYEHICTQIFSGQRINKMLQCLDSNTYIWNPRANPTVALVSYISNAVKIYNATSSLARFESKNNFFYFVSRTNLLQRWRCRCKFASRRIGSRVRIQKPVVTYDLGKSSVTSSARLPNYFKINL
jgi:hypothetical protein